MVYDRDPQWQATYQQCLEGFLQQVRELSPDNPMAYDMAANEQWAQEAAEEAADREHAQRMVRQQQIELSQIRDEAQAELWRGWYDLDEDGQMFIDAEDVPIGVDPHIKQVIDESVRDGS